MRQFLRWGPVLALLAVTPLRAEVKAGPVSFASGEETISAYLAEPEGRGPFPGMIVIHEWWGLNDGIKEVAREFASHGYMALAVDLYRGSVASDVEEAHELSRGLPEDRAVRDMKAALAYLQARPDVKRDRIGSAGWCMGGGYSLSLAVNSPELAACAIFYGRLITDQDTLKKISAPVIGFFGEEDRGIPVASVRAFEQAMQGLGKPVEMHLYPGAGHAFALPGRTSYREDAAQDAWKRTWAFFDAHLKKE